MRLHQINCIKFTKLFIIVLIIFLSACKSEDVTDEFGRIEIVLASLSVDNFIKEQVTAYNKSNPDFFITIVEYLNPLENFEINNEKYADAMVQFDLSIISNSKSLKSPDIFIVNSNLYHKYASRSAFVDLTDFYQSNIDITTVYQNVFEALKINGKLFGIAPSFGLYGICMDEEIAELGMAFENMVGFQKEVDYSIVMGGFRFWLPLYMHELIDWETRSCNFNNQYFKTILEMSKSNPNTIDYNTLLNVIRKRKPLFINSGNTDMYAYQGWSNLFNGNMVFSAYPEQDSIEIDTSIIFALSNNSNYISEAWDFICSFFDTDYQIKQADLRNMYGIPISRAANELLISQNADKSRDIWQLFGTVKVTHLEPDVMADFCRLLEHKMRIRISDDVIINIIFEETEAYFTSNYPLEWVIDNINNRVQLYLNEL